MHENPVPLLTFESGTPLPPFPGRITNDDDSDDGNDDERPGNPRRWYHYVPLASESRTPFFIFFSSFSSHVDSTRSQAAVLLLLAPHPSILFVLLNYHYLTLHAPYLFIAHLLAIYTLSFLAFSSLIVCVARDPGPIPDPKSEEQTRDADIGAARGDSGDGDEMSLQDALLAAPLADDYTQPGKWCRICWRPKPERAHHCSQCGRCILKMGQCRFFLPLRASYRRALTVVPRT
jgi:palmitoyltransferase ZDHHC2/15/20